MQWPKANLEEKNINNGEVSVNSDILYLSDAECFVIK